MQPYLFIFEAKPRPDNKKAEGLAGAMVYIWVFSISATGARASARDHLSGLNWMFVKEQAAFAPTPKQLRELEILEELHYQKAQSSGIAVQFYGWLENSRPGVFSYPLFSPLEGE
ncbi:MAG: hypothetical protein KKI15_02775 [Proteobacteria bacterium]|nr:hypothetical protein [Pseudomonadota bacterium]